MCLFALMVLLGFYEASSTSARNRPHEPTASKPVVPRGYVRSVLLVSRGDAWTASTWWWSAAGPRARWRQGGWPRRASRSRWSRTTSSAASARSTPACRRRRCCGRQEILREVRRIPGAAEAVTGELDVQAVLDRRDEVIHDLDDSSQLPWLEDRGIKLYRGFGVLAGEKRVDVGDDQLEARQAVILAGGTRAAAAADRGPARGRAVDQPRGHDRQADPRRDRDPRRRRRSAPSSRRPTARSAPR